MPDIECITRTTLPGREPDNIHRRLQDRETIGHPGFISLQRPPLISDTASAKRKKRAIAGSPRQERRDFSAKWCIRYFAAAARPSRRAIISSAQPLAASCVLCFSNWPLFAR